MAKKKKHKSTYTGNGMIDSYKCSCGWKSGAYFDGCDYALADFECHKDKIEAEEAIDAMWHT